MVKVERLAPDRFAVTIEQQGSKSTHTVRVSRQDLDRWGRGGSAEDLVRRSFEFLLARESTESILREFEISVIQRYFPEYDAAIRT